MYLVQIDDAQIFSRLRMCIKFVIQVCACIFSCWEAMQHTIELLKLRTISGVTEVKIKFHYALRQLIL